MQNKKYERQGIKVGRSFALILVLQILLHTKFLSEAFALSTPLGKLSRVHADIRSNGCTGYTSGRNSETKVFQAKLHNDDGHDDGGPYAQGRRQLLAAGILAVGSMVVATPEAHQASAIPLIDHLEGSMDTNSKRIIGQPQEKEPLVKVAHGKQLFEAHCASCHANPATGATGGNVFAPARTLTRDALVKHGIELSQESVSYFIRDKRVHRGVFSFSHLENASDYDDVAEYILNNNWP